MTDAAAPTLSLVEGGPLARALVRVGLWRPWPRALATAAVAWLPLLLLSAAQDPASDGTVVVPFLGDFASHARFLLAMPLFALAEITVAGRVAQVWRHFVESGLVAQAQRDIADRIAAQVRKAEASALAELVCLLLALAGSVARHTIALSEGLWTWQFGLEGPGQGLSAAGWWFALVSIPLFQFLLYRWVWRYLIWCWALWRASRLDLDLLPTHPDLSGGLGFLTWGQLAFHPLALAVGCTLAGAELNRAVYVGATLPQLATTAAVVAAAMVALFIGPLLMFSGRLLALKVRGSLEYSSLGRQYTHDFHRRWIRGDNPEGVALLGAADIQSLADLGNSFDFVRRMRVVPATMWVTVGMAAVAAAPFLAPVLVVTPTEEVLRFLAALASNLFG